MRFIIGPADQGTVLKEFLEKQPLSKRAVKLVKMQGDILVNGIKRTVRYMLEDKDIVELIWPEEISDIKPYPLELKICYEDDNYLIIDKPAGLPSIPTKRYPQATLANAIVYYYQSKGLRATVHLVNRLDKQTQGLLLVAKNSYSHYLLSKDIKQVRRVYHCLVDGVMIGEGTIDQPIIKAKDSLKRIIHQDGKRAITHYRVLKTDSKSLVECVLQTGRTHQIRVHLASIDHPLAGDQLYGSMSQDDYYLDSVELSFVDPFTKKQITITKESKFV